MAPRARTVLPLTILLLHLLALGDVSAKKDPLRNRRVGDGPFRDLLKIDEDDEGGKGNRSVKNHALRHRKAAVKFKDDNDEEEEEEEDLRPEESIDRLKRRRKANPGEPLPRPIAVTKRRRKYRRRRRPGNKSRGKGRGKGNRRKRKRPSRFDDDSYEDGDDEDYDDYDDDDDDYYDRDDGYEAPSPGYKAPSSSYDAPSSSYDAPSSSYDAPSTSYDAPSSSYDAPSDSYDGPSSYEAPSYSSSDSVASYSGGGKRRNTFRNYLNALAAFLPIGLFLAAVPPNVITINTGRRKKRSATSSISEPEFTWPFLDLMGEIGFSRVFEDADCQRRILCEMALLSESSNSVQRLIHHALAAMPETLAAAEDSLGLEDVRAGRCGRIECKNADAATKKDHVSHNSEEFNP